MRVATLPLADEGDYITHFDAKSQQKNYLLVNTSLLKGEVLHDAPSRHLVRRSAKYIAFSDVKFHIAAATLCSTHFKFISKHFAVTLSKHHATAVYRLAFRNKFLNFFLCAFNYSVRGFKFSFDTNPNWCSSVKHHKCDQVWLFKYIGYKYVFHQRTTTYASRR